MKSFHGIVQRSLFIVYSDNAGIPGQGTGELLFEECTLDGEREKGFKSSGQCLPGGPINIMN